MRSLSKVIKVSQYRTESNWRQLRLPDLSIRMEEMNSLAESGTKEDLPEEQGDRQALIELERMRILREAEDQAEARLKEAEEEINRLRKETVQKWEEEKKAIFQKANEEGYKEGYEAGFEQGIQEGEKSLAGRIAQAEGILTEASLEARRMKRESEEELLQLSVQIAEKILRHTLEENRELFLEIVKGALLLNEETHEITIRVHPERYLFLKSRTFLLDEMISNQTKVMILPDLHVDPDGVILQTSKGKLDAGIASQLEEIRNGLIEAFRKEDAQ